MERVGNEESNRTMDFGVVVAFDETLKGSHKVWHDTLRNGLGFQRIEKPLNDPYAASRSAHSKPGNSMYNI
jgi:hypothetical protein